MLLKLRQRMASEESGFTLIELLVVMLIIGILAAIAIPTFFNQKSKASDSSAKEMAHSAQVALETFATDHNGSYSGVAVSDLQTIEPTVGTGGNTVTFEGTPPSSNAYQLRVTSTVTQHWFQINKTGTGITFTCGTNASGETLPAGGCPASGVWAGA
jgi:prepilin-type N-terminal cleavage/methylation domain-containing protein